MYRLLIVKIVLALSFTTACSDATLMEGSKTVDANSQAFDEDALAQQDSNKQQGHEDDDQLDQNGDSAPDPQQEGQQPQMQEPQIIDDEDSVSIPTMTTGAFITSCSWQIEGLQFSCQMKPDGLSQEDLNFTLKDEMSKPIPSDLYQVETILENGLINLIITLAEDIPDWSLEVSENNMPIDAGVSKDSILTTEETEQPMSGPDFSKLVTYTEANFLGAFTEYDMGRFDVANAVIASLKMPPGYGIDLCSVNKCVGFYGDIPNIMSFTEPITSISIYESEPFVTVFDEGNFGGSHQVLSMGTYPHADLVAGIGDDKISSCHIPAGLQVKLCEHPGGGGFCDLFTSSVAQLGAELNNDVTHIEITEDPGIATVGQ